MEYQSPMVDSFLPEHLRSFELLDQHFRAQLEGLSASEKGRRFARFVQRLVPRTKFGLDFDIPELQSKESYDGGVDLTSQSIELISHSKDSRVNLYIQAKLRIDRVDDVDSIVSKFKNYLRIHDLQVQQDLFESYDQTSHFLVVTLSPLKNILRRYEGSHLASRDFYQKCKEEKRIEFIDGPEILPILQAAYRKIGELPADLILDLEGRTIRKGDVFFGIISSVELQKLYQQFGDALFFENVRDFLGLREEEIPGRTTPNSEIIKTINECPQKMLARNNGIVFRSDKVETGESNNQLRLTRGSIVNGCQTTMCMILYAREPCYVPVKVVQTDDSWDIAKAANYQNSVDEIDLVLARNLRPQLAKRAAAVSGGIQIEDGEKTAFRIIDEIYTRKVVYNEVRLLYIGMFSRKPSNLYNRNYTELMKDLIENFYNEDPYGAETFEILFALQGAVQEGLEAAEQKFRHKAYAGLFGRVYKEDTPSYKCFVGILALCGAVDINIAEREKDLSAEYKRMKLFLSKTSSILESDRDRFIEYYKLAFKVWMQEVAPMDEQSVAVILKDMSSRSRQADFTSLYRRLCMDADYMELGN